MSRTAIKKRQREAAIVAGFCSRCIGRRARSGRLTCEICADALAAFIRERRASERRSPGLLPSQRLKAR